MRNGSKTENTSVRNTALVAVFGLLVAGTAHAALDVDFWTDFYGEVIDHGTTYARALYNSADALDCGEPPTLTRSGNTFHIRVSRYDSSRAGAVPCPYHEARVELGTLLSGLYVAEVTLAADPGPPIEVLTREFRVRPYLGSCNRYPSVGSIVNVYHKTLDGTGVARMLAADPALMAALGNPVVSLTLYNNRGAQLVYPTPEDPVPWQDRAEATGLFDIAARTVGRGCLSTLPPPDSTAAMVEYHHPALDAYFYTMAAAEIAALDGSVGGWARTGQSFRVISRVCGETRHELFQAYRFFGRPGAGPSTHVFTIDQQECYAVNRSGAWQFEGMVFYAMRPNSDDTCVDPAQQPLFRIWRPTGESRHRFTVDRAVVAAMTAQGWIAEGAVMCVPRG